MSAHFLMIAINFDHDHSRLFSRGRSHYDRIYIANHNPTRIIQDNVILTSLLLVIFFNNSIIFQDKSKSVLLKNSFIFKMRFNSLFDFFARRVYFLIRNCKILCFKSAHSKVHLQSITFFSIAISYQWYSAFLLQ